MIKLLAVYNHECEFTMLLLSQIKLSLLTLLHKTFVLAALFWIFSGVVVNLQCKTTGNGDIPLVHDSFQKADNHWFMTFHVYFPMKYPSGNSIKKIIFVEKQPSNLYLPIKLLFMVFACCLANRNNFN